MIIIKQRKLNLTEYKNRPELGTASPVSYWGKFDNKV